MTESSKIDEQLYSRQLYAIGHDTMISIKDSSILIMGLSGLGTEIAKNASLIGFGNIDLYDGIDLPLVTIEDVGNNYYCSEEDISNTRRIDAVHDKLKTLNQYVNIQQVDNIDYKKYSVIICTSNCASNKDTISRECRNHGIKYIFANSNGLWGSIFCDFGENHHIKDIDGEELKTGVISEYDYETGICTTIDNHNLVSDDTIKINDRHYIISVIDATNFGCSTKIQDFQKDVPYRQMKKEAIINFKPYYETRYELDTFKHSSDIFADNNTMRLLFCADNEIPLDDSSIESQVINKMIGLELTPMNSILGGIVGQEVLKAVSHKYIPITQYYYHNELGTIISNEKLLMNLNKMEDVSILDRYSISRKIFGDSLYQKVLNSTTFVIGSGAIGCELLKNLAMIGVKSIDVTDMDSIEKSNLNRQFLFRDNNIGQPKSVAAASAIRNINPDVNIISHVLRVCDDTDKIFDRKFYKSKTCILNALDNVEARKYVDTKCVNYKVPLLESGTMGGRCSTQPIIPHLTQSYNSVINDANKNSIPICTIKSFPYRIEHTIQYAREQFEYYFNIIQRDVNLANTDRERYKRIEIADAHTLHDNVRYYEENYPHDIQSCVIWAYKVWHEIFRDQIMHLTTQFPVNYVNKDGIRFWSGLKKYPTFGEFNPNNKEHMSFVISAAILWYKTAHPTYDCEFDFDSFVRTLVPHTFVPSKEQVVSENDDEERDRLRKKTEKMSMSNIDHIRKYFESYKSIDCSVTEFEKDDNTNFHIDFITATSNNRAINYHIETANKYVTKGIAGKIIPALATTTSLVGGLVSFEFYKIVAGIKDITKYKSSSINLADSFFCYFSPTAASNIIFGKLECTLWDTFNYYKSITPSELIDSIEKVYNVTVSILRYESFILFSPIFQDECDEYKNTPIIDIIESKYRVDSTTINLNFSIEDQDDDIELPVITLN